MNRQAWAQQTTPEAAYHRAAGRRRHNAARRRVAQRRLFPLAQAIARTGDLEAVLCRKAPVVPRGLISAVAKDLGVHRSTVWRDVRRLARFRAWSLCYYGATGIVTIRLRGLGTVAYRL